MSMTQCQYIQMTDRRHAPDVVEMMHGLYEEDSPACKVVPARFPQTIDFLLAHPERGQIMLFAEAGVDTATSEHKIVGYAVIIPYWSNEVGGTIIFVDEVFVKPHARRKGLTRGFFAHLKLHRPFDARAIWLEVSPANSRATALYESMGMHRRRNHTLEVLIDMLDPQDPSMKNWSTR